MPCSFSGPMYCLTKSYEEVLDDYTMLHEKQAAPDLYAWKDFHDILMEPESIVVFVPKKWQETKNISLLELQIKSDMFATHKCYDRPLNPMIFEATIEFMKIMCTHMYEDSNNPIVVPLYIYVWRLCDDQQVHSLCMLFHSAYLTWIGERSWIQDLPRDEP